MIKTVLARIKQGYRTIPYPVKSDTLPSRFLGRPVFLAKRSLEDCDRCRSVCPTDAVIGQGKNISIDLGKCLFCGECQRVCAGRVISFTREYQLAALQRQGLVVGDEEGQEEELIAEKVAKIKKIFGRSLKLRQVSAGGCNACEADINVLGTLSYDLGRFGIQFVASPRHADGLVVTGPVTQNMTLALKKTYEAMPSPKIVIAVGACAISGGPYRNHPQASNGVDSILPVDLYIPGCPPHPLTILDGLLKVIGRNR